MRIFQIFPYFGGRGRTGGGEELNREEEALFASLYFFLFLRVSKKKKKKKKKTIEAKRKEEPAKKIRLGTMQGAGGLRVPCYGGKPSGGAIS